ncbi:hypothetical protein GCM10011403_26490 [Pseudohongiella nitratireducens]|jgi:hypothetical protein|uniref:CopC domain-containing protein n=1 Tax=Pseudohongiella nitratireducens TaxID=1768907 RepID=A0A916QL71_9GAMM|nr:copper resistance CopC family protein [Pseudohongiella nitratireducens]GFZ81747.1 hypothetical protein GCM10011403_26490 [Pseudohongiella nitratireducens]
MMKRIFSALTAILALSALLSGQALAHTALSSSMPGNQSTVVAPDKLVLKFGDVVRLVDVKLVHGPRHVIDFGFQAPEVSHDEFGFALPELMMGEHTVTWTAIGPDGHTVSDSFTFTNAAEGSEEMAGMTHGGHSHNGSHSHGGEQHSHGGEQHAHGAEDSHQHEH